MQKNVSGEFSDDADYEVEYDCTDGDDVDENDSVDHSRTLSKSAADLGYTVVCFQDIQPRMHALIDEVASIFDISWDFSHLLLRQKKWNREKLVEDFCDSATLSSGKRAIGSMAIIADNTTIYCEICCDRFPSAQCVGMNCAHNFCSRCYSGYINCYIEAGPASSMSILCPQHGCGAYVPPSMVFELATIENANKYQKYAVQNYIQTSRTMRYCPSPGCDYVILSYTGGLLDVTCKCKMVFCFSCNGLAHIPCTCYQLSQWNAKCQNESETANWILANTKQCPKCKTRIEKNQGCNHMTCRLCTYEFCWICVGPWTDHGANTGGYYKCNKYEIASSSSSSSDDGAKLSKAKQELDRYLHYYQRYQGHSQSFTFASDQLNRVEGRMLDMQERMGVSYIDVQYLRQAIELLVECRRCLKYTYVLGYFISDLTPEKVLFEDHQQNLEKFTEHLSGLTEEALVDKAAIINYTSVTERFMHGLISSVQETDMPEMIIANQVKSEAKIDGSKKKGMFEKISLTGK